MDLHYSQTWVKLLFFHQGFTTLWIYTILKLAVAGRLFFEVSLPYGFTLFSNYDGYGKLMHESFTTLWIYTILKPPGRRLRRAD